MRSAICALVLVACGPRISPPPESVTTPPASSAPPIPIVVADAGAPPGSSAEDGAKSSDASFEEVVERMRPRFRACYMRSFAANPGLKGAIVFDVTIDEKGQVAAVHARQSSLPPDLELCLERVVRAGPFGVPDVAPAHVVIPVKFAPP